MGKRVPGRPKGTSKKARQLVREFDAAVRNDQSTPFNMQRPEYLAKKSALLKFIAKLEAITGIRDFHHDPPCKPKET